MIALTARRVLFAAGCAAVLALGGCAAYPDGSYGSYGSYGGYSGEPYGYGYSGYGPSYAYAPPVYGQPSGYGLFGWGGGWGGRDWDHDRDWNRSHGWNNNEWHQGVHGQRNWAAQNNPGAFAHAAPPPGAGSHSLGGFMQQLGRTGPPPAVHAAPPPAAAPHSSPHSLGGYLQQLGRS